MFTKRELESAIAEYENKVNSFNDCQKLAVYHALHEHYFGENEPKNDVQAYSYAPAQEPETIIGDYGDSDFLIEVCGRNSAEIWAVIDELMDTLAIVQPKLYSAVMRKITEI